MIRTLFVLVDRIGSGRTVKLLGWALNMAVIRVVIKCSSCLVRPRFFSSITNSKLACLTPASFVVLFTSSSSSVLATINLASASPRLDTTCSPSQPVVLGGRLLVLISFPLCRIVIIQDPSPYESGLEITISLRLTTYYSKIVNLQRRINMLYSQMYY